MLWGFEVGGSLSPEASHAGNRIIEGLGLEGMRGSDKEQGQVCMMGLFGLLQMFN